MDVLNFISWLKAGKYSTTAPIDAVTVIGVPNTTRGDAYLPATVPISALQTNIGKLMGGGIVVSEWVENGVHKALVASSLNLGSVTWTVLAQQGILIGPTAQSWSDGFTNTNAIIAQTGAAAANTYAAGAARLHTGGGFTDWYLPSQWELTMCYNSAAIVNKILGATNGFGTNYYWSSTEGVLNYDAWGRVFYNGAQYNDNKNFSGYVRAVRIHTL
jgi:hypothetical protein